MAILSNRTRVNNNILGLGRFILFLIKKFFGLFLILFSCYLLYFSSPQFITNITLEVTGQALSIGNTIYSRINHVIKSICEQFSSIEYLNTQNLQLKLQIESLLKIQQSESILRSENIALRTILNVPTTLSNNFVTAKVIGASINPFSSSIIIQSGI